MYEEFKLMKGDVIHNMIISSWLEFNSSRTSFPTNLLWSHVKLIQSGQSRENQQRSSV
jgi:hypothetical protein